MDNKHAFWQAFVIAVIIFMAGIMLGIVFENSRTSKLEGFYRSSETEIFDVQLTGNLLANTLNFDCSTALEENIKFAERIYQEARTLEKYDESNKITEDIINIHKKYDLLRTMLWINMIEFQKKCPKETNTVVYLYQYIEPSIEIQAKQNTMSKIILELKKKYGDKVILIPIAYDTDVASLNLLKARYEIKEFPVVIINQEYKTTKLSTLEELEKYMIL